MPRLLLASNNPGKLHEIKALLAGLEIELLSPGHLGIRLHVTEDGQTYAENAARKARAFSDRAGLPALADDSGLEVEALDGAPGLYSARFSPRSGADDADRRGYLLTRLQGRPQPWSAKFWPIYSSALVRTFEVQSLAGFQVVAPCQLIDFGR